MRLPPVDLVSLRDQFREFAAQLRETWDASNRAGDDIDSAALLRDAMAQLVDVLCDDGPTRRDDEAARAELNTLCEYGLHLIDEMSQLAAGSGQPTLAGEIERLCLPFALWMGRRGGEIRNLAPVVNALAHFANSASQPQDMAALYACCCELIEAVSPACQDPAAADTRDPWRLLLLNRAIVATRSHNPELMESAFDAIVELLPGDAPRFFAEGMEQMAIIDYPDHVRDTMQRYYLAHATPRRLH